MAETYGKVYILWDPAKKEPLGKPKVSILPGHGTMEVQPR